MSMAPCRCGQCQLCNLQDGLESYGKMNDALRAQVEELEKRIQHKEHALTVEKRDRERAEAALSEQALNIVAMTHMHDALRKSMETLTERNERIMAWARGNCSCCGSDTIDMSCVGDDGSGVCCNWTPPKEWGVK